MKLTIIGSGPGGYETASAAAQCGIEVTIISGGLLGGTCLNEGCVPTKSFCKNAEIIDELKKSEIFGISNLKYDFDFNKVVKRKNEIVKELREGVRFLMDRKNITLVCGMASLKDNHTVVVDGKEYVSDYIIIATGSHSANLPIEGNDLDGVITSKEMLDIGDIPERLCIIGAGVIGLEFASIFNSFGSKVSVLEYCKYVLPRFDTDLSKRVKRTLGQGGIEIETSARVTGIENTAEGLKVNYLLKDKEHCVVADKVLMAVGRRPNVNTINLDDIGIEYSSAGIVTDKDMRTNIPNIFAVGDVTGGYMLAHVATFQGRIALSAMLREYGIREGLEDTVRGEKINMSIVPAAVFTTPEIATVGMSRDDCKVKGIKVKCNKSFFRANGRAMSMNEPEGFCKLVIAKEATDEFKEGQILGCHIFGAHAADLVQEIAALMNYKATVEDLRSVIHAHPTLTEVVLAAAGA